jgi:hypothetical protein
VILNRALGVERPKIMAMTQLGVHLAQLPEWAKDKTPKTARVTQTQIKNDSLKL